MIPFNVRIRLIRTAFKQFRLIKALELTVGAFK